MRFKLPPKSQLRKALMSAFPLKGEMDLVAADASGAHKKKWLSIVTVAPSLENAIQDIIDWSEAQQCLLQFLDAAIQANPQRPELQEVAARLRPVLQPLQELDAEVEGFERILFKGTYFEDIGPWLDKLARIRGAICRIEPQPLKSSKNGFGTGFLVGDDLVITAWHVARDFWRKDEIAQKVVLRFGCENDAHGNERTGDVFGLKPDWTLPTSAVNDCDFALLRLDRSAAMDTEGQKREYLALSDRATVEVSEPILILQHPDAMPLKLALGSVTATEANKHIWYKVNTEGGSSGSPCLTQNLEVIGLHHYGTDFQNRGIAAAAILPHLKLHLSAAKAEVIKPSGTEEASRSQAPTPLLDRLQSLACSAYDRAALARLSLFRLKVSLNDAIAPLFVTQETHETVVRKLIEWAVDQDRVIELAEAMTANAANKPEAAELKEVLLELRQALGSLTVNGVENTGTPPSAPPRVPDALPELIRRVEYLRNAAEAAADKVARLNACVEEMRQLPLGESDLTGELHLSASYGERLAAVVSLQQRPDQRYRQWLAERLAVEDSFLGYHASLSLYDIARTSPLEDLEEVKAVLERADSWVQGEANNRRHETLASALRHVADRLAGPSNL